MPDVTFSFDPGCPWTWRTSRWLVDVAAQRDLHVEWASFSLSIVNEGRIPEERRERMANASRTLRLVEALRGEGRNDDVARFYAALGVRLYGSDGLTRRDYDGATIDAAAREAGVDDFIGALDDASLDAAVRASHERAFAAAGPDIGSPVITVAGCERGLHGPILSTIVRGDDALVLWDAFSVLVSQPAFFELKRGRA